MTGEAPQFEFEQLGSFGICNTSVAHDICEQLTLADAHLYLWNPFERPIKVYNRLFCYQLSDDLCGNSPLKAMSAMAEVKMLNDFAKTVASSGCYLE